MNHLDEHDDELAPVKAYSLGELMILYGKCRNTIKGWIRRHEDKIGPRVGHFYTREQVRILFRCIDHPDNVPLTPVKKKALPKRRTDESKTS